MSHINFTLPYHPVSSYGRLAVSSLSPTYFQAKYKRVVTPPATIKPPTTLAAANARGCMETRRGKLGARALGRLLGLRRCVGLGRVAHVDTHAWRTTVQRQTAFDALLCGDVFSQMNGEAHLVGRLERLS